jgi:hypothetical protein
MLPCVEPGAELVRIRLADVDLDACRQDPGPTRQHAAGHRPGTVTVAVLRARRLPWRKWKDTVTVTLTGSTSVELITTQHLSWPITQVPPAPELETFWDGTFHPVTSLALTDVSVNRTRYEFVGECVRVLQLPAPVVPPATLQINCGPGAVETCAADAGTIPARPAAMTIPSAAATRRNIITPVIPSVDPRLFPPAGLT